MKGTSIQALVWFSCTIALGCSIARADSAVLLPPAGDPELVAMQQSAQRGLSAALREAGLELRSAAKARTRSADAACEQIACAPALLDQLHADIAVGLAVWRGEHDSEVNVTIVDSAGTRYPGRAPVGADAGNAARTAMLQAQALRMLGPGPWVSIDGEPAGASVWIDGRFAGSLPYRAGVTPGDHKLEVRADGHAAKAVDLKVPLEPTSLAAIEVKLEKATAVPADQNAAATATAVPADQNALAAPAAEPANESPATSSPSPWNFVVGGALIIGGGVLIVADPVRAAVRDGRCADPKCDRVYRFGTRSALELALGVALAGAGVTMLIWQPLRVTASVGADHAQVSASLRF